MFSYCGSGGVGNTNNDINGNESRRSNVCVKWQTQKFCRFQNKINVMIVEIHWFRDNQIFAAEKFSIEFCSVQMLYLLVFEVGLSLSSSVWLVTRFWLTLSRLCVMVMNDMAATLFIHVCHGRKTTTRACVCVFNS